MAARPPHILIIEDEPVTRTTLAEYLSSHGYTVTAFESAESAEPMLASDQADLLLVDITLDGKDGLQITREQRARSDIGIILTTSLSDDVDRIVGLELGADDYVCKPFNRRELLARIKNLLRRTEMHRRFSRQHVRFHGFSFAMATRQLTASDGASIRLTRAEFELLAELLRHPGEVLSRERLMSAVTHRQQHPDTRTVDVIIRRLRTKLEEDPAVPRIITTAHGEGYVFTATLD
ncbi:two-component system, OmpR family, torCAD operon response regulator TorR [Roseovarius azorensis]|uniref:Regulatory protein VirG n=1 Tax=Roseovarius azorensis TaxID=1287727 RepID=A0A1H7NV35_9RHOB|nr:winged helix-turn-helix domain-containing protein [Roseovarius azorensis]SEL27149.1 two-component system, OmpR family, torCAD operon response regulator TorR [Roseovarius azorensis]